MKQEIVKNTQLGEQYYKIEHDSGLTILLYPMKGYSSSYALFGTKYGSIDNCFKRQGEAQFTKVPEGIAHFLEHKLFESEERDAFARYAETGASANAYTSFDKTCYLFSCSDNFKQSLDILLDFVTSPYFTEQTVQKEQGIIGQEIRMYDDDPNWQVYFNLLKCLYQRHPLRIDIAGTVESIAQITAQDLYHCYNTFYNLHNMLLAIAGNFKVEEVLESADRILKKAEDFHVVRASSEEPEEVLSHEMQVSLPVSQPLFQIGFKEMIPCSGQLAKEYVLHTIALECIAGESSELYRKLYDAGLINSSFGSEIMLGDDYRCTIFGGEGRDPGQVREQLAAEIRKYKEKGIPETLFEQQRKALYGRYVRGFGSVDNVAGTMLGSYFLGLGEFDLLEACATVSCDEVNQYLRTILHEEKMALSVVNPQQ